MTAGAWAACVSESRSKFCFTDTASVHTYPMKAITEIGTFQKRSPG